MSDQKILIVDDEDSIRRFLRVTLESQKYLIIEAATGHEALLRAAEHKPEIVILDLGLPDMDGVEVARSLREWTTAPIIILSVRGSEKDKIAALDAGADDYLTKPFGVGELLARVRAALRRSMQSINESILTSGDLRIDLASRLVTVAGHEVQLTPNEYDLLRMLAIHAGKVLTHRYLLMNVWGIEYKDEIHMLQVNISNLRRKIEPEPARPRYIITDPGVGYRLKVNSD